MQAQPIEAPKQTNTPTDIHHSQSLSPSLALQSLSTSYRVTMRAQPFEPYEPTNTPTFFKCHGRSRLHLPCRVFAKARCYRCLCNVGSCALAGTHLQRQSLTTTSILPSTTPPLYSSLAIATNFYYPHPSRSLFHSSWISPTSLSIKRKPSATRPSGSSTSTVASQYLSC